MTATVRIGDNFYRLDGWVRYKVATDDDGAPIGYDVWFADGRKAELRDAAASAFASLLSAQPELAGTPQQPPVVRAPSPLPDPRS